MMKYNSTIKITTDSFIHKDQPNRQVIDTNNLKKELWEIIFHGLLASLHL